MKKPSAKTLLDDIRECYWADLFGAVEAEHLGQSPSWPAETFSKHFLVFNMAEVKFAVSQVIADSLTELEQLLETEDDREDVRLWLTPEAVSNVLVSDATKVFGFLVAFVKTCAEKEIDLLNDPTEILRKLYPQVLDHQTNFEAMMCAKITKAFAEERGKAAARLEALDI